MRRLIAAAALAGALAAPAVAQADVAPPAQRMAGCLRAAGWDAAAGGRHVYARPRRQRPAGSLPRRPSYSVIFGSSPAVGELQRWIALNDREHRTVAHCLQEVR